MNKYDLLEQLRCMKYELERKQERRQAEVCVEVLEFALKGCPLFEFHTKQRLKDQIQSYKEKVTNLTDRIEELQKESSDLKFILPAGITDSRDDIVLAIDDLECGRAEDETGLIFLFNKRQGAGANESQI